MKPKIVFSEKCLEYGSYHIESPERVHKAYRVLKERGYEFIEPEPAKEEDLLKAHDVSYLRLLKEVQLRILTPLHTPTFTSMQGLRLAERCLRLKLMVSR